MNKYFVLSFLLASSIACGRIPAELENAIQSSDLEKVRQILPEAKLSELEKFALLDLAQEKIARWRLDVELAETEYRLKCCSRSSFRNPRPGVGLGMAILSGCIGGIGSILLATSSSRPNREIAPIAAIYTVVTVAAFAILEWRNRALAQERRDLRAAYENAVKIKQLLFVVPVLPA